MSPSNGKRLGFDQIRAAIVGEHDLVEAFVELLDMTARSKDMAILQGGLACLLACLRLVEKHHALPLGVLDIPDASQFLRMNPLERAQWLDQLLIENRRSDVSRLAALMVQIIQPYSSHLRFVGVLGHSMRIEFQP